MVSLLHAVADDLGRRGRAPARSLGTKPLLSSRFAHVTKISLSMLARAVDRRPADPRLARVRSPLEPRRGGLTAVFHELGRTLQGIGTLVEDRRSLPQAIASALEAEWIAFREQGGEWIDVGRRGLGDRSHAEQATRRIDFALLARLPRGRLLRLAGPALGRSPRLADTGIREVLVYIDSSSTGPVGLVVIALAQPLAVDQDDLEGIVRAWVALTTLRSRIGRAKEQDHLVEVGTRAACALHDLRHELTVSSLELDRVSTESAPLPSARFDRIRTAIATARALCEGEFELDAPPGTAPVLVAGLLRNEASAARSFSGRGEAIRIETRCEESLEFPADRGMLSRIMRNLVLNAIESSPDGERVSIEAEMGSEAELVLRVIDHGRGMSAADREDLFRFGRSGRGGWGIGSASIETCARRIGATQTIESRLGSGTCVELRVPPAGRNAEA